MRRFYEFIPLLAYIFILWGIGCKINKLYMQVQKIMTTLQRSVMIFEILLGL